MFCCEEILILYFCLTKQVVKNKNRKLVCIYSRANPQRRSLSMDVRMSLLDVGFFTTHQQQRLCIDFDLSSVRQPKDPVCESVILKNLARRMRGMVTEYLMSCEHGRLAFENVGKKSPVFYFQFCFFVTIIRRQFKNTQVPDLAENAVYNSA